MSEVIESAVKAIADRVNGRLDGSVKFVIRGEGAIVLDADGVRASDAEAAATLTADLETFRDLIEGRLSPTAAYMTGKLSVDGDMAQALKLGTVLG